VVGLLDALSDPERQPGVSRRGLPPALRLEETVAAAIHAATLPSMSVLTGIAAAVPREVAAVQTEFVDDPKQAVRKADELVAAAMQSLASTFADHKPELETQWREGEVETEQLRLALRQYRSFFNQLLKN